MSKDKGKEELLPSAFLYKEFDLVFVVCSADKITIIQQNKKEKEKEI